MGVVELVLLQPQPDVVVVAVLPPDPFAQAKWDAAAATTARLRPIKLRRPTIGNPVSNAGGSVSSKPFDVVKAALSPKFRDLGPTDPRLGVKASLNRRSAGVAKW